MLDSLKKSLRSKTNLTALAAIVLTWLFAFGVVDAKKLTTVERLGKLAGADVTAVDVDGDGKVDLAAPTGANPVSKLDALYVTLAGFGLIFLRQGVAKSGPKEG